MVQITSLFSLLSPINVVLAYEVIRHPIQLRRHVQNATSVHPALQQSLSHGQNVALELWHESMISYTAEVKIGDQNVELRVDTESGDTWVTSPRLEDSSPEDAEFEFQTKGNFKALQNTTLQAVHTYGLQGSSIDTNVTGCVGHATFTIGNITLPDKIIGLMTDGTYYGEDGSSGILGLGLPGLLSAKGHGTHLDYDTVATTMYRRGFISEKIFSMSLSKGGGVFVFGGIPDVVKHDDRWAISQVRPSPDDSRIKGADSYGLWTITVDGANFTGANGTYNHAFSARLSTSSPVDFLDEKIANTLGSRFDPPARKLGPIYIVDCNATAPDLALHIGGQRISYWPETLTLSDERTHACYLSVFLA